MFVNGLRPNEHFEEEYLLDLEGTALQTILGLKIVDNVNTTTNHVVEVCDVLGIEAARGALYMEIDAVISFNRCRFTLDFVIEHTYILEFLYLQCNLMSNSHNDSFSALTSIIVIWHSFVMP